MLMKLTLESVWIEVQTELIYELQSLTFRFAFQLRFSVRRTRKPVFFSNAKINGWQLSSYFAYHDCRHWKSTGLSYLQSFKASVSIKFHMSRINDLAINYVRPKNMEERYFITFCLKYLKVIKDLKRKVWVR